MAWAPSRHREHIVVGASIVPPNDHLLLPLEPGVRANSVSVRALHPDLQIRRHPEPGQEEARGQGLGKAWSVRKQMMAGRPHGPCDVIDVLLITRLRSIGGFSGPVDEGGEWNQAQCPPHRQAAESGKTEGDPLGPRVVLESMEKRRQGTHEIIRHSARGKPAA